MTTNPAPLLAAGLLLIADGRILLVQRAAGSDHVGEWCVPGGGIEEGESAPEAALRECAEEVGTAPVLDPGELVEHYRRVAEGVDYTTYLVRLAEPFEPVLQEDECSDARWFTPAELPPNLHPGTRLAIERLGWDELRVAEAMRDGDLTSPQHYMNLWLFDLRITGTGFCYRTADGGEFAFRNPEDYLNERFLRRSAGLPVIWEHPDNSMLTSQEFADRVVGSILLPYIKGDEVWGIAKVHDVGAADAMRFKQLSTSPAVVLRKADEKVTLDDGTELLIEGRPALLDHLAICEQGVWDKLQAPSGVNSTGDHAMAEDADKEVEDKAKADTAEDKDTEAKADAAKKDASDEDADDKKADANLDTMLSKLDSKLDAMCSRLDALESRKADAAKADAEPGEEEMAEKVAADKGKKDSEDEAGEAKADAKTARADAARAVAENAELRRRLDTMAGAIANLPKSRTDADITAFAEAQARADSVYGGFGTQAPEPLRGEDTLGYRRRLVEGVKKHSSRWSGVDSLKLDGAAFDIMEQQVYADAMAEAANPADLPVGVLREINRTDRATGQRTVSFAGKNTFISGMKRPAPRARISSRPAQH